MGPAEPYFCLVDFFRDYKVVLASLVRSSVLRGPFAYSGYLGLLPCVRESVILWWEGYPAVVCSIRGLLGSPVQERHEQAGESPVKGH